MIDEYIPFAFRMAFSTDIEDMLWSAWAKAEAEKIDLEIMNKDNKTESLD